MLLTSPITESSLPKSPNRPIAQSLNRPIAESSNCRIAQSSNHSTTPFPLPFLANLAKLSPTMETVNIHEAKTQLSRLIERVKAGEEVVIAKAGKPVARLVAVDPAGTGGKPGPLKGPYPIGPEFYETLPRRGEALTLCCQPRRVRCSRALNRS